MANIATITNNIISALSGTSSQILLGDATLTDFKLDSLTDVSVPTPGDGDVLKWNATTSLWEASDSAGITGSGLAGQVAYFTGATTQAGSNNLFWDNANGRLGIGTASPSYVLDVNGAIRSFSSNAEFRAIGGGYGGNYNTTLRSNSSAEGVLQLGNNGANYIIGGNTATGGFLVFKVNGTTEAVSTGTEAARIFANGRFGINTGATDSGQRLQVVGDARISTDLGIGMSPSAITNYNSINIAGTTGTFYRAYTGATETFRITTTSTTNSIQSFSGNLRFDAGAVSNAMTLFSSGNLVVASTGDSGEKLQVTGTMKVTGATTIGGNLTVDTNTLFVDATNNRVGVGTASPTLPLTVYNPTANTNAVEIRGGGGSSQSRLLFTYGSDTTKTDDNALILTNTSAFLISVAGSRSIILNTNSLDRATLDASGNLGLGVTPSAWFSNSKAIQTISGSLYTFSTDRIFLGQNAIINSVGVDSYYANGFASRYGQYQGTHFWQTAPSGTAGGNITFTQAMTLDASGRFGVGTDVIGTDFKVAINGGNGTTTGPLLVFQNTATGTGNSNGFIVGNYPLDAYVWNYENAPIIFGANNGEGARLTPSRNLHIGTFSSDSGEKLQVTGTMKVTGASTFGGTITTTAVDNNLTIQSTSNVSTISFPSTNGLTYLGQVASNFIINVLGTTRLTIASTGASTFNGTVTANSFIPNSSSVPTNGMYLPSANTLGFATNSTLDMTLDASGNLGLGVTPSAWGFSGNIEFQDGRVLMSSGQYLHITQNAFNNGTNWIYKTTNATARYSQELGKHIWYNAPSGSANANITFTQAMTLDASGRLGVGVTSPLARLHSSERIYVTLNSGSDGIVLGGSGASSIPYSYITTTNDGVQKVGIAFHTTSNASAGTEKVRIFDDGNFGIGTGATNSGEKLQVNGTAKITGATTVGGNLTIGDTTTGRNVNVFSSSYGSNGLFQAFGTDGLLKLQMGGLGNTTAFLYTGAGNAMQFFSGNAVALTLASNQAATFSSSVTANSLIATALGSASIILRSTSANGTGDLYFFRNTSEFLGAISAGKDVDIIGSGDNIGFWNTRSAGGFTWRTLNITNMVLDSLGNLGLGITNPTSRLHVNGTARVAGTFLAEDVVTLTNLSGTGTRIVVASASGILSTQPTSTFITSLTGEATSSGGGATTVTLTNSAVIGKVLTGLNINSAAVTSSDSILSAFGKLQGQIDGLQGGTIYKGSWNAATNTPTITSSTGTQGNYYVVTTAGTTTIDGVSSWAVGDWIIFNGTVWEKIPNVDAITSVNGQTGVVSLTTTNINEGTSLYYTDARARGAISLTTSGSSGAATYSSGVFNIPTYTLTGLGGVASSRILTINGTPLDLSSDRAWSVGTVTSVNATVPTGFTIGSAVTTSGNIAIGFAAGYSLPTTTSQSNWDAAYNDKINSAAVTGTTTKTLTLNQQDGGTITASWTDINTDAVASVFGRTGTVVAVSGDYTTAQVTESGNLYYTDSRARAAISLTTTGTSGAATYSAGVLNIPNYSLSINYNNNADASYQMLWGSGNAIYGTAGITCNPFTDSINLTGTLFSGGLTVNGFGRMYGGDFWHSGTANNGSRTATIRLGRFSDQELPAYTVFTDDTGGDILEFYSERFTGDFRLTRNSESGLRNMMRVNSDNGGSVIDLYTGNGSTLGAKIQSNGDARFAFDVVAYYSFSDARLKTNVLTIENPLQKVMAMRGVSYEWLEGHKKGKKEIGLIAQEVMEIIPEVVSEKERIDGGKFLSVDYEHLTGLLIEAVKELKKEVDELKSK